MTQNPPENALLESWKSTLAKGGNARAVVAPSGETIRTFAEIEAESQKWQREFSGLPAGAVVAVQIGNSAAWPAVLLALFRGRHIVLPLGRHMETAELEQALEACRASAILVLEGDQPKLKPRAQIAPVEFSGPQPDLLKLTSGTTAAPRAIRFRAAQLLADCENICATMGFAERDLNFGVIPFSHSYGFSNLLTPLIARGVPLVASEDRIPRAILNDLARSRATVFPGMPVFYQKLAELEPAHELPHLRLCISAGAPLTPEVGARFTAKYSRRIHTFYGSSECGGIGYDRADSGDYLPGFSGEPMLGVEVERSAENVGTISVRSAAVGDGYFPNDEPATLGGGRFVPGDLIRWTEQGMFIEGRASDLINIAGRKLNPAEVEQRIRDFPGVREAVVFGVPSPLRGEEPVACVVAQAGVEAASVLRFCHAKLSQWQVPKDVWIVPEIPTNERGKVSRRALAERYVQTRP